MTSKEKENLISFFSTLTVSIPYFIFIFNKYRSETFTPIEELKFWATAILLLIPIRIIVQIIVHILAEMFSEITKNKDKIVVDERDKMIELKATRNSYFTFVLGFGLSLFITVANPSIRSMFIVLFITGFTAELVEIFSKICYYRKGL